METVNPWARYWAWCFDVTICVFLLFGLIFIFDPALLVHLTSLLSFLAVLMWMFLDAFCLYQWGSTPGRSLLKLEVKKNDGTRPTFSECLKRSFTIFYKGMGLALPVIAYVMNIVSYVQLKKNGATPWDRDGGFTVYHTKLSAMRIVAIVLVFMVLYAIVVVLVFAMPYSGSSLDYVM